MKFHSIFLQFSCTFIHLHQHWMGKRTETIKRGGKTCVYTKQKTKGISCSCSKHCSFRMIIFLFSANLRSIVEFSYRISLAAPEPQTHLGFFCTFITVVMFIMGKHNRVYPFSAGWVSFMALPQVKDLRLGLRITGCMSETWSWDVCECGKNFSKN